jgi:hypothetical protein
MRRQQHPDQRACCGGRLAIARFCNSLTSPWAVPKPIILNFFGPANQTKFLSLVLQWRRWVSPTSVCGNPIAATSPRPHFSSAAAIKRPQPPRHAASRKVYSGRVAYTVNGQQHSSSYFVCNSQYHGLVQGGALAPATGGSRMWGPLPASLPAFPLLAPALRGCG